MITTSRNRFKKSVYTPPIGGHCEEGKTLLQKKVVTIHSSTSVNNATEGYTTTKKEGRKVTVSLALDAAVVEKIKRQASTLNQSFNTRVNAILEKYVNYFSIVEMEHPAILTRSQHQFFVDEINEEKYTNQLKRMGIEVIHAMFVQTGMANTLDNFIRFVFEGLCVNGGSIRTIRRYIDEDDGMSILLCNSGICRRF